MKCYEINYDGKWEASNVGNSADEAIEQMAKDDGYDSLEDLCAAESLDISKFTAVESLLHGIFIQDIDVGYVE